MTIFIAEQKLTPIDQFVHLSARYNVDKLIAQETVSAQTVSHFDKSKERSRLVSSKIYPV